MGQTVERDHPQMSNANILNFNVPVLLVFSFLSWGKFADDHSSEDRLAPSHQDAKLGILFFYLGAFARWREISRTDFLYGGTT